MSLSDVTAANSFLTPKRSSLSARGWGASIYEIENNQDINTLIAEDPMVKNGGAVRGPSNERFARTQLTVAAKASQAFALGSARVSQAFLVNVIWPRDVDKSKPLSLSRSRTIYKRSQKP